MKKFKIIFALLAVFLLIFTTSVSASAAETNINDEIEQEVKTLVATGKLDEFHLQLSQLNGYKIYYYKRVHLMDDLEYFANHTEQEIMQLITWYQNELDDTWSYIIDNLDLWVEYLDTDQVVACMWDSYFAGNEDDGYLFLVWCSPYIPSEFVNILEFTESGKTYHLYDDEEAKENLDFNWDASEHFHFPDANLSLHLTPIGGISDGEPFGVPLKRSYSIEKFKYGIDDAHFVKDVDPTNRFSGECTKPVKFDFGLTPKQDGKNYLQMVTHSYRIIDDCMVQSHFDLNFGAYRHEVYFSTAIDISKIYRVDVSYKITNDEKDWYEFWLPEDEHLVTKSLSTKRASGGFLGLSSYAGFSEGSYQSTVDGSKRYKYKLHLNYDDDAWKIFRGGDLLEGNYKRVSDFQILRLNFVCDNEVYDVPVAMDCVDGKTLNILSPDLIMDTDTLGFKIKNGFYDFIDDVKSKVKENKNVVWIIIGSVILIVIIVVVIRIARIISNFLSVIPDRKDKSKNHKRE